MSALRRRALLGLAGAATAGTLSGCTRGQADPGGPGPGGGSSGEAGAPAPESISYGDRPEQIGRLYRPAEDSDSGRGVVVVVIHGGFWRAQYGLDLGNPLAADLAARGWVAWNIEYRRLGNGGGFPETFDDVAAAIDHLATLDLPGGDVTSSGVVTLGHSAGGHLAVWAAARSGYGWPAQVPVTAAVSQAGVLDLADAARSGLGGDTVTQLVGPSGPRYQRVDPAQQVPLAVPVRCVHGRDDTTVPIRQSERYVDAATAAGADARLERVPGDHFAQIDPDTEAWQRTVQVLTELG